MNTFYKYIACLLLIICCLISTYSFSQSCAPLVVTGSSTTPATCPSSGNITVSATGTALNYQIIDGPTGYPPASNSTGIFNGLVSGNYTIQVRDGCNRTSTLTKTIANAYNAFSVSAATTSNVCTSGAIGGTVNGTVTGGKAPYQYDVVLVGSTPVYGSNTVATSFSKNFTAFGTYRFYVKDACGEVRTYDVELSATQPLPTNFIYEDLQVNRPCSETMDGLPTVSLRMYLADVNGTAINFNDLVGSTYQIYKPQVPNSINTSQANCTNATGALLNSGTILAANINPSDVWAYEVVIPREDIILIITTKCGQQFKYCLDFNGGSALNPDIVYRFIQQSCAGSWSAQKINIYVKEIRFMSAIPSFTLTKNGGATIVNSTGYFSNLSPDDLPATVSATDTCGRTVTKTIPKPVQGSVLQATVVPEFGMTCTTIQNTATAEIIITGGDLPGIGDATNVVITGGTVTAVPVISTYNDWIPGYKASNLLAGYTYKVRITNLCGEKDSVQFTVPNDHWGQSVLTWNLTATVNQLCGQNKGTITANSHYSGFKVVAYYLYNIDAPNTVLANNTTGVFTNLSAATYKVKFMVPSGSTFCPNAEIKDSILVTVIADGGEQTINRKVTANCESGGTTLATGKAIVEVNGSAPFTYEIIKTSLIGTAGEVWNLSSTGNPSNTFTWDLPLVGDASNTIYTFRSTDKCGNKVTTIGTLQPLGTPVFQTTLNPCIGQLNYSISLVPYPSTFTYRWVKLPDLVTTLSTQSSITFPGVYTVANNGTYRCYISLAGCVDRVRDVTINSSSCSAPLATNVVYLNGSITNNDVVLKWMCDNSSIYKTFEVERSFNGIQFEKISAIPSKNLTTITDYTFNDNVQNISALVYYYRLKLMDKNGKYEYTNTVRFEANNTSSTLTVYPNPVKNVFNINLFTSQQCAAMIKVMDLNGRVVVKENVMLTKGFNSIATNKIAKLPSGTYILELFQNTKTDRVKFVKE